MAENGKWQNRIIETVQMRVGDLAVNKYNPKHHPASQETRVEAVLEKFGIVDSLIAWRSDRNGGQWTIFDGHLRQKLDPDQVWTVHKTSLTDQECDELAFYFDPLAGMSLHDEAKMTALMQDLGDVDGVLGEMLGELAEGVGLVFGDDGPEDPGAQLDKAAELQEAWRVKRGQVWEIPSLSVPGKAHRLMCGDSTDAGDVGRLVGAELVGIAINDPPYGMRLDTDFSGMVNKLQFAREKGVLHGRKYDNVVGDSEDFNASPIVSLLSDVKEQFWFGADYYSATLPDTQHNGSWLVWDKRLDESADKMFGSCFELIWSRQKHKRDILRHKWAGIFGTEHEPQRGRTHPNQKPVALLVDILNRHAEPTDVVVDLFLGSGTTLVACEQTARIGYGMEIEPKYCSVALDRLQRLGLEPRLVEG